MVVDITKDMLVGTNHLGRAIRIMALESVNHLVGAMKAKCKNASTSLKIIMIQIPKGIREG